MFRALSVFIATLVTSLIAWGNQSYLGHTYEVHSVSFSKDGRHLASGSGDRSVIVWNLETEAPVFVIQDHKRTVYAVAFSKINPNILVTSSSDGELAVWDISSKSKLHTLAKGDVTGNGILSMDFSPKNNNLVVGFMGGEIEIWNIDTAQLVARSTAHHIGGFALSVKYSPEGKHIYSTGGADGGIYLYRSTDATLERVFQDLESSAPIWDIAIKKNGEGFFTVNSLGELIAWNESSQSPQRRYKIHDYLAQSIELSKDESQVFVGVDALNSEEGNNIKIIKTESGEIVEEIPAHKNRIRGMDLSPDGSKLATGSWDFSVKTWLLEP